MHSFAPFVNLKISAKNRQHFFAIEYWMSDFFQFLRRILHFFWEFLMIFFPDFAPNSRKEWRLSLFNQICENKLEHCRNFWNLWKLFIMIQYYSIVSLLEVSYPARRASRDAATRGLPCRGGLHGAGAVFCVCVRISFNNHYLTLRRVMLRLKYFRSWEKFCNVCWNSADRFKMIFSEFLLKRLDQLNK